MGGATVVTGLVEPEQVQEHGGLLVVRCVSPRSESGRNHVKRSATSSDA